MQFFRWPHFFEKFTDGGMYGPTPRQHFFSAIENIRYLGRRAVLAFAGIAIGCCAVTALINMGSMAQAESIKVFKGLGSNLIIANLQPSPGKFNAGLTPREFNPSSLLRALKDIKSASGVIFTSSEVKYGSRIIGSLVIGESGELAKIMQLKLTSGRFLGDEDSDNTYVLLGYNVAHRAGYASLNTGENIVIGNYMYKIVGILKRQGENYLFPFNIDDAVVMPVEGMKRVIHRPIFSAIMMVYQEKSSAEDTGKNISNYLKKLKNGLSVNIQIPESLIDGMKQQTGLFSWLLICIGGVSMLAGGIGVMNVMLMNIAERKKEIGIRLAIGARPFDITIQFLLEALILSAAGALVGSVCGIISSLIFFYFSVWSHFIITPYSLILGVTSSLGTGLFFGLYPAMNASKIEPVRALNDA